MNDLSVSVIIPAYNAAHTIGRALESVFAQTLMPNEIIVVDDGSPDDFSAALQNYANRVTYIRKANGGAASARNLGINKSRGNLIAFLDADDYWHPSKLELQVETLRRHPEVGLVAGWFHEEQPGSGRVDSLLDRKYFDKILNPSGDATFEVATQIWMGTVLIRRGALGNARFVSGLEPAEDRDLWIRIAASTPVYLLSTPLATAVLEPHSLSRSDIDVDCANMLRVIERNKALLSPRGRRRWRALTFRRWAAIHLENRKAREAFGPAFRRVQLQPWSIEGWWVLAKCVARAVLSTNTGTQMNPGAALHMTASREP